MTYLHSYRAASFRFLLVWAFGAVLLSACSKEKKSASSPAGPDTLRTEDIRTIERQYDQQPQSLPPEAQGESSLNQAVDQIDRLENQDEMQVAIQALHKDVAMIQDLLKKYRATGQASYKEQALVLLRQARRIQEKVRSAAVIPEGENMVNAGDLFRLIDNAWAELQQ